MKKTFLIFLILFFSKALFAEGGGGGKGSIFLNYHTGTLSQFSNVPVGNIMTVGGYGVADLFGGLRLGGGGGAGFIIYSASTLSMGYGYGGIVAELRLLKWLTTQCLLGGGGYALSNASGVLQSGGFLVLHPTLTAEIDLSPKTKLGLIAGFFMPNETRLATATLGVSYIFGGL